MARSGATILIVDDSPLDIDLLLGLLDDYELVVAMDGPSALGILDRESPDLILLDIALPGVDGFEVCARIKTNRAWADIPVLFMTAYNEEGNIARAFAAGGNDYVAKPFRPKELFARIGVQLQYRRVLDCARQCAMQDALTNVLSRRAFFLRGGALLEEARRQDLELGVVLLNLVDLKSINDGFGHAVGDLALQELVRRVERQLEQQELFGRLGGGEFAILLPGWGRSETLALAARLRREVRQVQIPVGSGYLALVARVGSAVSSAECDTLDSLLTAADEQRCDAQIGRNPVWDGAAHPRTPHPRLAVRSRIR